jgi:hypothetical protein
MMFSRCTILLSDYHHGALIKVLSNKSRSQRSVNSAFLTKAEIILKETGIKDSDLDFSEDDHTETPFAVKITLSKSRHPILFGIYNKAPLGTRKAFMASVLSRCAEYIANNPAEFDAMLTKAFIGDSENDKEPNEKVVLEVVDTTFVADTFIVDEPIPDTSNGTDLFADGDENPMSAIIDVDIML